MKNLTTTTLLLMNLCLAASADPGASVTASAEPTKATIGDRIQLKIRFTHPDTYSLKLSSSTELGDFQVVDQNLKTSPNKSGGLVEDLTLTLVTFSTGTVTVPPMALSLASAQHQQISASTPAVPIQIESVLDKHKDRRDIQDLKGQIGYFDPLPWILGLLAAALAGLISWAVIRNRKPAGAQTLASGEPPRPPEIKAQEALTALRSRGLVETGRVKEFYVELSDIMRRYLQDRYGLSCLDMTTSEITREMRTFPLSSSDFGSLRSLLQDCDLVKFAKFIPAPEEADRHLAAGLDFVGHTTPRVKAAP